MRILPLSHIHHISWDQFSALNLHLDLSKREVPLAILRNVRALAKLPPYKPGDHAHEWEHYLKPGLARRCRYCHLVDIYPGGELEVKRLERLEAERKVIKILTGQAELPKFVVPHLTPIKPISLQRIVNSAIYGNPELTKSERVNLFWLSRVGGRAAWIDYGLQTYLVVYFNRPYKMGGKQQRCCVPKNQFRRFLHFHLIAIKNAEVITTSKGQTLANLFSPSLEFIKRNIS